MSENKIILNNIKVNGNRVEYYFSTFGCYNDFFKKDKIMYIEYNYNIEDIGESILSIAFVGNIIPFIWLCDGVLELNELDKEFFECLDNVKKGFEEMYPNLQFNGKINVKSIIENCYKSKYKSAQLFSGGLDAVTTYTKISCENPYLITHWGADISTENYKVWNTLKDNVEKFSKENKVKNIFIKSNYRDFLNENIINKKFSRIINDSWYHGIQHGLMLITSSIPILCKLNVENLYIASSYYERCEKDFGKNITCGSDPKIDNKIKFASGKVIHDGYELKRQDKIKIVTQYAKENRKKIFLKVCHDQKSLTNCCNCEKCYRTILGILAEGENPNNFGFNISDNIGIKFREFLEKEVINFAGLSTIPWNDIKNRLSDNRENVMYFKELEWFINYDIKKERKKKIYIYRIKNIRFILYRKIIEKLKVS